MSRLPFPLAVDSNALIYLLEGESDERQRFLDAEFYRPLVRGEGRAIASTIAVTEFLARPWRLLPAAQVREHQHLLFELPNLSFLPVDFEIALLAAELRGRTRLKLPDAIHVATAIQAEAEAFLTNDSGLARAELPIPVLRLDDLLDD